MPARTDTDAFFEELLTGVQQEKPVDDGLEEVMSSLGLKRQTVDEWLNQANYDALNGGHYLPTAFALKFMNFIKLVNGGEGEENTTPVVHLVMLDQIAGKKQNIANLCFRGAAKTTLFFEYLALYLMVFGEIDGFGKVEGMIYVSDSMDNGVKSARKNIEFRWENSEFLQEQLPRDYMKFTDNYLEFKEPKSVDHPKGRRFGVKMFGAKTGLRGTKIFGKRPVLCVLDDLVSDDDAKSKTAMQSIRDTITKGVDFALHPKRRKTIFNGTPFNKGDVLYQSVESGAWHVNVWPVCERFPCSREEFRGAWEDRFDYDFVMRQYQKAVLEGTTAAFYQELMLRITSDEERLVQDAEIRWYGRAKLLEHRHRFNFYITTDFATKGKQSNDFSVISVWAYNANGDWFWVDGICVKQTMDKNINDLFRLVQMYKPQAVGIEVAGQQGAFIQWIMEQMMVRNTWFTFAQGKNGQPGIQPEADKLSRFNLVVPLFKSGKIYLPLEMKASKILAEMLDELRLATLDGLKSKHDDMIDTISMLMYLKPWKPSEEAPVEPTADMWEIAGEFDDGQSAHALTSYIV
jgi:predicted phage terminase large subunit-like protein